MTAAGPPVPTWMLRSRSPLLSRIRLIAALLFAVLHVGRIGVEWIDDARLSSASPVELHIEDADSPGHGTPPHALHCAICATMATPALPARGAVLPVVAVRATPLPVSVTPLTNSASSYLPPARGPPLA